MNYIKENFSKWTPKVCHYMNNRLAVEYMGMDEEMGGMISECIATVNIPDENIEPDEVIIKDYSENEGIYECMLEAGHIGPVIRYAESGFIMAPVCKLLLNH